MRLCSKSSGKRFGAASGLGIAVHSVSIFDIRTATATTGPPSPLAGSLTGSGYRCRKVWSSERRIIAVCSPCFLEVEVQSKLRFIDRRLSAACLDDARETKGGSSWIFFFGGGFAGSAVGLTFKIRG